MILTVPQKGVHWAPRILKPVLSNSYREPELDLLFIDRKLLIDFSNDC